LSKKYPNIRKKAQQGGHLRAFLTRQAVFLPKTPPQGWLSTDPAPPKGDTRIPCHSTGRLKISIRFFGCSETAFSDGLFPILPKPKPM